MLQKRIVAYLCLLCVFLNIFMGVNSYLTGGSSLIILFNILCASLCGIGYVNWYYSQE